MTGIGWLMPAGSDLARWCQTVNTCNGVRVDRWLASRCVYQSRVHHVDVFTRARSIMPGQFLMGHVSSSSKAGSAQGEDTGIRCPNSKPQLLYEGRFWGSVTRQPDLTPPQVVRGIATFVV
ncbi:hypothetical protein B0T26DRAFT_675302 [Lasiosphaeria miniovina]|uniref:Uncharacterized protein n=1 Tax=Lasiosphaeria miniovina TaxID=1954250 RepID=A0AA40AJA7_9PEZI|nr:uncharacterized protein B0T26DRAFT_675302 [Lasiosphaeria miniovina]KAK0716893.1 hypothetical protein B0T26DRAFT_675302 [Lasiosphaeria miniovina]